MGRATRWLKGLFGMKKDRDSSNSGDRKDKNLSCLGRSRRESPVGSSWLKSVHTHQSEDEQNKHAIAVAAATAAAADAAVAAAQAAVAVVRLTSQGRGATAYASSARENLAAIKIQSAFRAYLSRKALRALRGLVKLQALVRGYLVRKQAAATLHGFEALVRAQSSIRAKKPRDVIKIHDDRYRSQFHPRRSTERFDETRSEYTTSIHSRRLSSSFEAPITDESPKIVEVDPGRPKSRLRRANTWAWAADTGEHNPYARLPARLSIPSSRNVREFEWAPLAEECVVSTAQSTPRFANSYGSNGNGPVTPSKSVCMDGSFSNHPNYMASTKSFKAKSRSHSAPKQRPDFEFGSKKRASLTEVLESRNSISCGVRMQRSSSQAQEATSFKNVVVGRLGRSSEINW